MRQLETWNNRSIERRREGRIASTTNGSIHEREGRHPKQNETIRYQEALMEEERHRHHHHQQQRHIQNFPSDPSSFDPQNLSLPLNSTSTTAFRPRKIRKIEGHDTPPDKSLTAPLSRLQLPPVLHRNLSAEGEVALALRHLRAVDPQLARLIDIHDPPVFQNLHPPFLSLARSILYQQLAVKAAASIYARFLSLCGGEAGVVPNVVLGLSAPQLRQIGVSARKASYLHDLSSKYCRGILSDSAIVEMDDKSLFSMLTMVKGIGAWSVHMFMIFTLHRPDVLPVGDLGVRKGVQILYGLDYLPRPSQMEQLCERWRPYRSVGSWYMWRIVEAKGPPSGVSTDQQQQLFGQVNGIAHLG